MRLMAYRMLLGFFAGAILLGLPVLIILEERLTIAMRVRLELFLLQYGLSDLQFGLSCLFCCGVLGAMAGGAIGHYWLNSRQNSAAHGALLGMLLGAALGHMVVTTVLESISIQTWPILRFTTPGIALWGLFLGGARGFCKAIREESLPRASPVEPIMPPEQSIRLANDDEAGQAIKVYHAGKP